MSGKWDSLFSLGLGVVGALPILAATFGIDTATSIILLGIILVFVVLGFIASFLTTYFKRQATNMDAIHERVKKLEEHINYMEKIAALDKRLAVIEETRNRKGVIDPRIVILVILLFLLYLYFRNIGLLG